MADIAGMKSKVAIGVGSLNEAEQLMHMAGQKIEETVALWQTVSDHPELAAAITTLNQAAEGLEQVIVQKSGAVVQAENYAAAL